MNYKAFYFRLKMCLAPPHKTESTNPAGWKRQDGGEGKRWRDLMFPVGKERWGKFREWGRSNLVGVEQTVALVTTWVSIFSNIQNIFHLHC